MILFLDWNNLTASGVPFAIKSAITGSTVFLTRSVRFELRNASKLKSSSVSDISNSDFYGYSKYSRNPYGASWCGIFVNIFPEYSHHHDSCLRQQLQRLWECSNARSNRFFNMNSRGLLTISSELAIESKGRSDSKNAGFFSWIFTTFFISRSTRFWDFSRWGARFSLLNGVELKYHYFCHHEWF